ncbi:hypothetical protein M472_16310 [Sphingobacterium paucimobilis HER1398]|uniref:Bet v I/Major latex protein domain-containing protein n=2 Tax=Sphingobacterium TaxID=28453 RepID=U2JCC6_9SPHI|nr:hypothetical protein M472_03740 [Sphingobacterium paucimobilis HER1398]ERJ60323.1 hypothetical protein M472_16310 [Sphingobacterium paucimobilis HER1398]
MAAAQQVQWAIDEKMEVPVERDVLWAAMKDYSLVEKLSNGLVLSIINKDDIMPILREVTFKDGSKREELLSQVEDQHRFLVFKLKDSSLPKGIKSAQFALFTKEKGDASSELNWRVHIEGSKDAKELLIQQFKTEIEAYKIGYAKYLSKPKSVPAMRMN